MTLLADPPGASPAGHSQPAPIGPSRPKRLWRAPLRAHVAALAVVLLALVPLIGTGASFSADEGAAIIQARSLSRGDGWVVAHPVPEADPAGLAYPLELSERGPRGIAPFGKHPLYALLLAGADRLAGVTGMVLLSLLGTVAAAAMGALLAARIDRGLARPAIWVIGLASPLLFDGYLVIAHTLGAAAGGAVLAAATAFERRSRLAALAIVPWIAVAVLLRTEAVFLALGLAGAAAVVGWRRDQVVAALVAGASVIAALAARLGEGVWIGRILGGSVAGTGAVSPPATSGFLADRWQAFSITWLRPSYGAARLVDLLLLVMLVAVLVAAHAARRGRPGVGVMAAVSGVSAVAAVVLAPANVVPGLLIACPVLGAGLMLTGRRTLATTAARLAAVTSVVFTLVVVATQYSTGGSGEWGGRYFALALPIGLPVVLLAIRHRGSRGLVAGLVVCSLALSVMAVGSLRAAHRRGAGLIAAIDRTAGDTVAGSDRPVLVTTAPLVPRMAWPTFDRQRWLLSRPGDLPALVDRLDAAGIERFTFVARSEAEAALLPATVARQRVTTYGAWRILVLRIDRGP